MNLTVQNKDMKCNDYDTGLYDSAGFKYLTKRTY